MNSEKNWPTVYLLRKYQVQHQEQDAGAQRIDGGSLDEAEAPKIPDLLEFQLEDLARRAVQALDLLLRQTEALDEFNITQRLGR